MSDLKVPSQTACHQPLASRWEPCACPQKTLTESFNMQTCPIRNLTLRCMQRHLSQSILAVTWAFRCHSLKILVDSYKHLIRRNKSAGCITGLFGKKHLTKSIDIHHTTRLRRQNLHLMEHDLPKCGISSPHFRTVKCFRCPVFIWNLAPPLSSVGFIPQKCSTKTQMVDHKKVSWESQIWSTSKSGRSTNTKVLHQKVLFFGLKSTLLMILFGIRGLQNTQVHDNNVIITPPPTRHYCYVNPKTFTNNTCDELSKNQLRWAIWCNLFPMASLLRQRKENDQKGLFPPQISPNSS